MLALEGITILDLSGGYPPAMGTQILGDHGANVINVEGRPALPGLRPEIGSKESAKAAAYDASNRNKKSIILNLKTDEARQIFYKLAEEADVVVEPFRPGVTKRLGVDYQTISKVNPKIIYCSVTGYGQDGPYAHLAGHDPNYLSIAGVLDLIGEPDGPPVPPFNLLADVAGAGVHTALSILLALMARTKTGKGQYIDLSFTDCVVSFLTMTGSTYFRTDAVPKRGSVLGPPHPGGGIYATKDNKYVTIACPEPWLWENFCRAIGREDFIPYNRMRGRLADPKDQDKFKEIQDYFQQLFLTRTRDEWFDFLSSKDVPFGKVLSMDEAFKDPHVLHRKMVIEVDSPTEGKVKQVGIPVKLSDTPGEVRSTAPLFGQHTDEILKGLGYSAQEIKELRSKGVVS